MKQPSLIRPGYFSWLIVLLLLWGIWHLVGTPYFIWERTWVDSGQGYSPLADRYYTQCHYLKLSDVSESHSQYSANGKCAWVFFPQWHNSPLNK